MNEMKVNVNEMFIFTWITRLVYSYVNVNLLLLSELCQYRKHTKRQMRANNVMVYQNGDLIF